MLHIATRFGMSICCRSIICIQNFLSMDSHVSQCTWWFNQVALTNRSTILFPPELLLELKYLFSVLATWQHRNHLYSDYKRHTIMKFLVAIDTFTGVFIFVSSGFSGNSSDRFTIIEHSGILDILKTGQRILADKGSYTARDLSAQKRCF